VIGLTAFSTSQIRSRDATRKSDLKQIASALELYYNDYNTYPSSSNGRILGCPSNSSTACGWGEDQFTDGKTVYLKVVPSDPASDLNYYYKTVAINGVNNQGFSAFCMLENTRDTYACIGNDCGSHPIYHPKFLVEVRLHVTFNHKSKYNL
jgi:Tfp pilus assembly protein PilE